MKHRGDGAAYLSDARAIAVSIIAHPWEAPTAVTVLPAPTKAKILGRISAMARGVLWYVARERSTSPPAGKLWPPFTPRGEVVHSYFAIFLLTACLSEIAQPADHCRSPFLLKSREDTM